VIKVKDELDDEFNEDELGNEFEALLINIIDGKHDKVISGYFIIIKSFLMSLIILTSTINAFINDLISHSFLH
jgi:hypothetical protein